MKNGNDQKNWKDRRANEEPYVGAPYNFVSFSDEVYSFPVERLTKHDTLDEQLFTGELGYKLTAQTPIFVDGGTGEFNRDAYGNYSIPGSTMRGLIRNNVQILGLCSMADDIDADYKLMYRNVFRGDKKREGERHSYNDILGLDSIQVGDDAEIGALTSVKAGYLTNRDGHYFIHPAEEHDAGKRKGKPYRMSYYIVSEKSVIRNIENYPLFKENPQFLINSMESEFKKEERIKGVMMDNGRKNQVTFVYYPETGESIFDHIKKGKIFKFEVVKKEKNYVYFIKNIGSDKTYAKQGIVYADKATIKYTVIANEEFHPDCMAVSYRVNDQNYVVHIGAKGDCENEGYCLSSGYVQDKKVFYIIPKKDSKQKEIDIDEGIESYQRDYNKRCNTIPEDDQQFYALPEPGETKTVFYIQLDGAYYFGFTPHLRLFYDYKIKDGVPEQHKEGIFDYSKAIFGFSNADGSYKSRVSFSDAVAIGVPKPDREQKRILSEPKPSSFMDYVACGRTYNQEGFTLRGVKQYWLRDDLLKEELHKEKNKDKNKNKDVRSDLKPLAKNTEFEGKIRFRNLTKEELGLLLWSVRLEPENNSQMNVGKGKPYGYGRIQVELTEVRQIDTKRAYDVDAGLNLEPYISLDADELINYYKDSMTGFLKGKHIDELPHIKEFFAMKNKTPDPNKIRYMKIGNKEEHQENEYQKRKTPLPTIWQTLDDQSGKSEK